MTSAARVHGTAIQHHDGEVLAPPPHTSVSMRNTADTIAHRAPVISSVEAKGSASM